MTADPVQQARDWLSQQTGAEPGCPDPGRSDTWAPAAGPSDVSDARSRSGSQTGSRSEVEREDPEADLATVARSIVVRKLAAQDRTRHELAAALASKNVPGEVADEVLARFEEVGLVDDASFAQRWVESRQARRHRSRTMLRRELAGKGIDRAVVDEALAGVSAEDEFAAAQAYVDKVAGSMAGLDQVVRRRRLADRLARRGFGAETIGRILKDTDDRGI